MGTAAPSASGRTAATAAPSASARAGAGHMLSTKCPRPVPSLPSVAAAVSHSRRLRLVKRMRTRVRAIASTSSLRPIGQEDDRQQDLPRRGGDAVPPAFQPLERPAADATQQRADHELQQRQRRHGQRRQRPEPGRARQDRPAEGQQQDQGGRDQAPPQVVEDLPALHGRQGVRAPPPRRGHPAADPGEDLPVAADPAMLAAGVRVVAGREVVEQLGVAQQAAAGEVPLDEVVAEDEVLGEGVPGGGLEGVDVVDALAGEAADPEEVHVGVGGGRRVGVDAPRGRQQRGEPRMRGRREVEAHPRLQDAVSLDHAARTPGRIAAD